MKKRINNFLDLYDKANMSVLPGQLAFFLVLSLVPAITVVMYLASFLHVSINDINAYFNTSFSDSIIELLTPVFTNQGNFSISLLIILIVGIYICSNGMNSVIISADNIYGIKYKSFLERRIKSIIMVVLMILLLLFILLVPVFGNFILNLIANITGLTWIVNIVGIIKYPITWLVVFIIIKVMYTIAPDKKIPSNYVNKGALFASIGWVLATFFYMYYTSHFSNYSAYYSGLANIAVIMIWMYILASIFVLGLAINYRNEPFEIEKTKKLEIIKEEKKK